MWSLETEKLRPLAPPPHVWNYILPSCFWFLLIFNLHCLFFLILCYLLLMLFCVFCVILYFIIYSSNYVCFVICLSRCIYRNTNIVAELEMIIIHARNLCVYIYMHFFLITCYKWKGRRGKTDLWLFTAIFVTSSSGVMHSNWCFFSLSWTWQKQRYHYWHVIVMIGIYLSAGAWQGSEWSEWREWFDADYCNPNPIWLHHPQSERHHRDSNDSP